MNSTVFECSICFNYYNKTSHRPLTLPCGHVYCFSCLNSMFSQGNNFCPADKIQHDVSISQLSCCYPILNCLANTPPNVEAEVKLLHCKKHPEKKIKFVCEKHKAHLCTCCVLEHTGAGHLVKSFAVDFNGAKEQAESLRAKVQKLLKRFKKYGDKLDKRIASLDEHYEKQEAKLKYEYAKVLKLASQKQQRLLHAVYEERKVVEGLLRSGLSLNCGCANKVRKAEEELGKCLSLVESVKGFKEVAERVESVLREVQNRCKRVCPKQCLRVILIEDRSEVKARHNHEKNTEQTKRTYSNARDHKKQGRRHTKKHELTHKLRQELNVIHRHETLSPIRDCNYMTPHLETAAATTKAAKSIKNIFGNKCRENGFESRVHNLINIQ